jgi:cysteine sulfinate desulfinase/cysteine desulfurase-like protein
LQPKLASSQLDTRASQFEALRAELEAGLVEQGATVFASAAERLPNTTYFAFAGIDGETLVGKLDRAGFAVAAGAACSSANPEPSHVLLAMGVASVAGARRGTGQPWPGQHRRHRCAIPCCTADYNLATQGIGEHRVPD